MVLYHWLTNGYQVPLVIGRVNGAIGITIGTIGITNGTIGRSGTIGRILNDIGILEHTHSLS